MRALVTVLLLAAATPASAAQFVVDVSERTVAITAGFTGAELVVFGTAAEQQGSAAEEHGVIVVIRGPEQPTTVRRKERNFGVWANHGGVAFPEAPAFVWVAASEAFVEQPLREVLDRYKIGQDFLAPTPAAADVEALGTFQEALVRRKQINGLYSAEFGHVEFLGEHLFRTGVTFFRPTFPWAATGSKSSRCAAPMWSMQRPARCTYAKPGSKRLFSASRTTSRSCTVSLPSCSP